MLTTEVPRPTEELSKAPAPEVLLLNQELTSTEAAPSIEQGLVALQLGENIFETNLPADTDPFDPDADPRYSSLSPAKLDELEPGQYWVRGADKSKQVLPGSGVSNQIEVPIKIVGNDGSKAIDTAFHPNLNILHGQNAVPLMEAIGFIFDKTADSGISKLVAIPTPETLKAKCEAFGVAVELLPDFSQIPPSEYLRVFSTGKYPVATRGEGYYKHDIEDDHITGLLLGGEVLQNALALAATKAMESGDDKFIGDVVESIDRFTQTLRGVIADAPTTTDTAYGEQLGRSTLREYGLKAGIPAEDVESILKIAQERAALFGFKAIKQLV